MSSGFPYKHPDLMAVPRRSLVQVSQESKDWVADPKNRVCDKPGGWLCRGQYPPALDSLIAKRNNFAQLEDFNKQKSKDDEKYQEEYHKRMGGKHPLEKDAAPAADAKQAEQNALTMVGCYASESDLPKDKVYIGE